MQAGSREWALDVLGVPESATKEQIEKAYLELQAVWEPHKLAGDEWGKARAAQELEKIETARRVLAAEPGDKHSRARPLNSFVLGVAAGVVFAAAFFGTRAYKMAHQAAPKVILNSQETAPTKVSLEPPTVAISSSKVSDAERDKIQKAIAGLSSGLDALNERDTLESMGEKVIPLTTQELASPDSNVRMNAALVINAIAAGPDTAPNSDADKARLRPFFDEAGTVAALTKLAADPNRTTRQNVAYGLGNIGDPSAVGILTGMGWDSDSDVRAGVAYSLGKLKDAKGLSSLLALLNDPELSVRETAVEALRSFDTPEVKSELTDRLAKETDPEMIAQIKAVLEGRPPPNSDNGQP